jgi:MFS transporter, DHA3 family, macrolide efflux protein
MPYAPPPNGYRTFLVVWVTQSLSVFGSNLTFFAITIWLTQTLYPRPEQKPELGAALAALSLSFMLPSLLLAPIAGAWADRHDRKRTMMAMDAANALLSALVVVLMVSHSLYLWSLLLLTVGVAVVSCFHGSAFDTSYAMLVPEEKLARANGLMQTMWSLSGLLAPAIAVGIITLPGLARQGHVPGVLGGWLRRLQDGAPLAIGLDAATFVLAGVTLLFLNIPSPIRTDLQADSDGKRKSLWDDVKEGARYIWHRRPLLWLLGTFTVINLLTAPIGVLQPLIAKYNLAGDWTARHLSFEQALAVLNTALGAGGLAGGVLVSVWGGLKRKRVYGVVVPMLIGSAALVVYGYSGSLWLAAFMVAVLGVSGPIANAHSQAIWQSQVPHALQGRVFSVRRVIAQCSAPLGTVIAGTAAGLLNPGHFVAWLGAFLFCFLAAQLFNRHLLRVEDKAWLDSLAAEREPSVVA